jgi:molybdate transport system ATP-binding protein
MDSDFVEKMLQGKARAPFEHLNGKKGVLFSSFTLNKYIREEAIHDDFTLSKGSGRSIRTFSSGEQKKALFKHLLAKDPDFMILDNVFDMLDKESHKQLIQKLTDLSENTIIIQLFRRRDHILPFMPVVWRRGEHGQDFRGTIEEYHATFPLSRINPKKISIPPPLQTTNPESNPLVRFSEVSVSYGAKPVLDRINWEINRGEFWQLIGPNGAGKTTLLTMITGDNPKAYGQDLFLFGRRKGSGESVWDIKKKIGYVTPSMTVLFKGRVTVENMVISGIYDSVGLYTQPKYFERKLANQWLDFMGLSKLGQQYFCDIPEEKQCMVLIARAMIKHPPLLILDEPTHGLDDDHVVILTALINRIAEESQTTLIYVSHKKEPGLQPTHVYELKPGDKGSGGRVLK